MPYFLNHNSTMQSLGRLYMYIMPTLDIDQHLNYIDLGLFKKWDEMGII